MVISWLHNTFDSCETLSGDTGGPKVPQRVTGDRQRGHEWRWVKDRRRKTLILVVIMWAIAARMPKSVPFHLVARVRPMPY